ncbi:type II secretion system GspH family protein [Shewanella marinintestina]|uniref:type II secretion system protein n=1 Tax=Shewanella marinintestina TaxID=190305 RepID=UPI00200D3025|nr:type II secretion system protein [Shewanella marinintestina]MCL1146461.1 type II secretion system GspH family protein [Shewanella marinintestina]
MQKQNGFTLIELVVVIIILGILAVTAAPKFINLQSDARASALQGVKGAIQGANGLVFAKSAVGGDEKKAKGSWTNADPTKPTDGVDIGAEYPAVTNFGYLQATETEFNNAIDADFGTTDTNDWKVDASTGQLVITQIGAPVSDCKLTYVEATATKVPEYTIVDTGC